MLPHNTVVVVADGHSAILFRNEARSGLDLTEMRKLDKHALVDDGAELDERSRANEDDEASFAVRLTRHLNAMVLRNKLDDIAIIADPSTLGVMRKHYHKELQLRLRKEVAKTLTNSDVDAIQASLA